MGGLVKTVFAFLARCTQKMGSGAGRGEIECLDRVFKSAFWAGDEMRRGGLNVRVWGAFGVRSGRLFGRTRGAVGEMRSGKRGRSEGERETLPSEALISLTGHSRIEHTWLVSDFFLPLNFL